MTTYEIITEKIMDLLEQGQIPWRKPWRSSGGPRNLISKRPYRGINQFILNCSPYSSPWFLTYKQASDRGGQVKRGEKSSLVVYFKWLDRKDSDSDDGSSASPGSPKGKIPLLRYYNVFSLDQVDGIKIPVTEEIETPFTPIETAEQIIQNMPLRPVIRYGGSRACYIPSQDLIQMPDREKFTTPEGYYDTLFHEVSHSTGHITRLGRRGIVEPICFGSHEYSAEELVAQFSSSMVLGHAGIEQQTIENSAAYIQNWLKVLKQKDNKKLLVHAAAQAQKAADFILRRDPTEEQ